MPIYACAFAFWPGILELVAKAKDYPDINDQRKVLFLNNVCDSSNFHRFGEYETHRMDGTRINNKGISRIRLAAKWTSWTRKRLFNKSKVSCDQVTGIQEEGMTYNLGYEFRNQDLLSCNVGVQGRSPSASWLSRQFQNDDPVEELGIAFLTLNAGLIYDFSVLAALILRLT